MSGADAASAEVGRLKAALDRQLVMTLAGVAAVGLILAFSSREQGGLWPSLLNLLPWIAGLAILACAANRATLALKTRTLRRQADARR
ncbi:hypothetical protein GCM10008171_02340 [Methylopila jiangsuensis]|uniref:Uncharacterized protein n=1 Tax=Methylopila jiangsuensis TaxID=586230 RepID=A0A9W6N274_9HYPH|nr:hypothetical protein [Methylopila jiangsuensis]MDR6287398.1 hypothetical protein [Methylopila jiangsuensis]GLK74980.1 hypothetical protein GCM10008171_02340 [Methylopila jiangsuensis]